MLVQKKNCPKMIISNKIKFLLEKQRPAGVEIITLRKMLKRTVNWNWINLASNTNKCMLPNGDRGLLHGPRAGRCVWRVIGSNSGKINYHISRGFVKINKGQCIPQAVPWPSALLFFLMLSDLNSANPVLAFLPSWAPTGITPQLRVVSRSPCGGSPLALAQPLPVLPLCPSTSAPGSCTRSDALPDEKGTGDLRPRSKL